MWIHAVLKDITRLYFHIAKDLFKIETALGHFAILKMSVGNEKTCIIQSMSTCNSETMSCKKKYCISISWCKIQQKIILHDFLIIKYSLTPHSPSSMLYILHCESPVEWQSTTCIWQDIQNMQRADRAQHALVKHPEEHPRVKSTPLTHRPGTLCRIVWTKFTFCFFSNGIQMV